MLVNPMRRSEASIREYILERTPIGMSMEDVKTEIRILNGTQHLGHEIRHSERGYSNHRLPPEQRIVGEKHIRLDIATNKRYFVLSESVRVYWGFDADGILIDVFVHKFILI